MQRVLDSARMIQKWDGAFNKTSSARSEGNGGN